MEVDSDFESAVHKTYVWNGLFEPLNKRTKAAFESGRFDGLMVRKGKHEGRIVSYRSVYGPTFRHSGLTYANTSRNLGLAAYRLFHDKVGGLLDLHVVQVRRLPILASQLTAFREDLERDLPFENPFELVERASEQAHGKRRIRMEAHAELKSHGVLFSEKHLFMFRDIQAKMKLEEWAKPGKYARIISDFGTPASLRAGWLIEAIKVGLAERYMQFDHGWCKFVYSVNLPELTKVFTEATTQSCFHYHSDDSRATIICSDGTLYYDLDISACDSSQGPAVFQTLGNLVPDRYFADMNALLKQCQEPSKMGYGKTALRFKAVEGRYFEYSGTLLTTMLNNIASLCVGAQLMSLSPTNCHDTDLKVREILETCGWKMDCVLHSRVEKMQFLKCSPVRCGGGYSAVMNLGVIMRCIGQKHGDLSGDKSTPLKERAAIENGKLVAGFKHSGNTSLYQLYKRKFPLLGDAICVNANRSFTIGGEDVVMDESLCSRYDITLSQYYEMLSLLEHADFGDVIDCHASRAILKLDYGL